MMTTIFHSACVATTGGVREAKVTRMIRATWRCELLRRKRMTDSFLAVFLTFLLVFGGLPADALAEAIDGNPATDELALEEVLEEVGTSDTAVIGEELGNQADDSEGLEVGADASEVELSQEDSAADVGEASADVAPANEVVLEASTDTEVVDAADASTSDVSAKDEASQPVVDNVSDAASEPELTAQATATPETINGAGFNLTLPSQWSGKVEITTKKLTGWNVGTLTSIWMAGGSGLIEIHSARRSEFKQITGWGDVCLIGRKTGEDYIVEVYMCDWPWLDFDIAGSSSSTRAYEALELLTGGEYTTCGRSGSSSYNASLEYAKQYVKSNILNELVLKKAPVTGKWVQSGSRWWYKLSDGTYPRSQFRTISGARYYFDASGWMVTGWRKISGAWYYFYPSGKMAKSAWISSGSDWYRVDSSGKMATGWQTVAKRRYWFAKSGVMATGWKRVSGKWYYFERNGAMVKSRWVGNYYLQKDGTMATNKWIGKYHVNAKGVWDKTR